MQTTQKRCDEANAFRIAEAIHIGQFNPLDPTRCSSSAG